MSRWFRFYEEALHDPKLLVLTDEEHRVWVQLLCIASKNEGRLPALDILALELRRPANAVQTVIERLCQRSLIDRCNGGANGWYYAPHNWDKFQYKSDTSAERMKRFRQRHRDVTVTPPDTETDTDTESKKKKITPAASSEVEYGFEGRTLKVTTADMRKLRLSFPSINLMAELIAIDDHYGSLPKERRWPFLMNFLKKREEAWSRPAEAAPKRRINL